MYFYTVQIEFLLKMVEFRKPREKWKKKKKNAQRIDAIFNIGIISTEVQNNFNGLLGGRENK